MHSSFTINGVKMQTKYGSDGSNHYIGIIKNSTPMDTTTVFNQQYQSSIIQNPSEYDFAIDKYNIPLENVPIFYFDSSVDNSNKYNAYSVELTYNGVSSGRTYVQFNKTYIKNPTDPDYYAIWDFDTFIKLVNDTIYAAFLLLAGATSLPATSAPPFFGMDSNFMLSSYGQCTIYDSDIAKPIRLYMNQPLWRFFMGIPAEEQGNGFAVQSALGLDALFLFWSKKAMNLVTISNTNYWQMFTNYGTQTLINWNIAEGIVITSNELTVAAEYMPTISDNQLLVSRKIIANFDFIYEGTACKPLYAQYVLTSPYKRLTIEGGANLNKLDFNIYWYDSNNTFHPFQIYNGSSYTMRLLFLPKENK